MRIRIVQTPTIASVDGVRLDWFCAGLAYEVGSTLGSYLLAEGWAEPAEDHESPLPSTIADVEVAGDPIDPPNLTREFFPPYYDGLPALAPDRPRRRRR